MGACYSKKAGQLGEAYSYPVRQGSPARYRKKTMNRTAPYPRGTAPPHSFGFRRRAAAVTSHRVTPADTAPASRRANGSAAGVTSQRVIPADSAPSSRRANGSQESVLSSSSGSDANGNTQRCATVPPRRLLPRPQVAHVKPRTATSAAPRPNRTTITKLNDSGLGATRGSLASSAASDRDEHDKLIKQEMAPMATTEEFHDVGEGVEESGGSDFQVGIRTDGATIALSVNIHKGVNAAVSRPQVTVSDPAIKARVTQIQRPGFGYTQPAGLTRPTGLSHPVPTSAVSPTAAAAPTSAKPSGIPASRSTSNLHMRPSRPSMVPQPAARASSGAGVGVTSPPAGGNKRSVALPVARPTHSILDQTVRSRVTRWEEKVHQISQDALLVAQTRGTSLEPAATMGMTAPGNVLSPTGTGKTGVRTARVASPVTPGALQRCLPGSLSSSPIALSTPITASVQQPLLLPSSGRKPDLKPKPTEAVNSIVQLRREMRQLTRDVATSPLHRPRLRDTGTCTEATTSPPRSQVSQGSGDLSPVLSAMQGSRSGIEDFIDDEIGDQPAFGAAYRAGAMSDSTHSDGFIDDVLTGVGLSLGAEPLPPLEITEAVKSCDVSDYVRPFRLTPRPVAALTTLETPLRRPAAEAGTTTAARRQQMEERAERLARRLQLQTPGSTAAATESDSDSGLGSTYQRLGLKDPVLSDSDPPALTTEEDVTESHDTISPEHSLPRDPDEGSIWSKPAPKLDSFSPSRGYSSSDAARSRGADRVDSPESRDPARPQEDQMLMSEYSREALKESHDSFTEIPRGFAMQVSRESQQQREDRPVARVSCRQDSSDSASELSGEYSRQGWRESQESGDSTREESLESRSSCGRRSGGKTGSAEREDREEESYSDFESQDEAFASLGGCRPRAASYRRVSELREDVTSPTASVGSDDLMADFDKDSDTLCEDEDSVSGQVSRLQRMRLRSSTDGGRPSPDPGTGPTRLLKPPRQSSQGDGGDWLLIDRDTYMYMAQDFTHTKTMLHKLRRLLQDAETVNPFENSIQSGKRGPSVSSESQLSSIDGRTSLEGRPAVDGGTCDLAAENADLKRQVASLQSQLEERDHTIHLLQQQMAKYATVPLDVTTVATQATQPVAEDPQVITVCAGK